MNRYVVHFPIRGHNTVEIYAETKADARRIVDGELDGVVNEIDSTIDWHGRAFGVTLQEEDV